MVLLDGTTPAYRGLSPQTGHGEDVLQLNRDLVALGFDPDAITIADDWQAATTAGVEELQRSLGGTGTGTLAFGQVVFLPGTQLVSTVDATLGGDGGGSGSGTPSTGSASDLGGAGRREYATLEGPASTPTSPATPKNDNARRGSACTGAPPGASPRSPARPPEDRAQPPQTAGIAQPERIRETNEQRLAGLCRKPP